MQSLESLRIVVGVDESIEVLLELAVQVVEVGPHGRLFDRSIHSFDLTVSPGVVGFCQAVVNVEVGTGKLERVGKKELTARPSLFDQRSCRSDVAGGCEMGPVVGKNRMDLVGHPLGEISKEVPSGPAGGFLHEPHKSEL